MKKIYYLSTCDTCRKILKEVAPGPEVLLQDIKTEPMQPEQVDEMARMAGSYDAIFSRKAVKYRELGLARQTLSESDIRRYILEEYTFLRRPVMICGDQIFVGNAEDTVRAAAIAFHAG
ncbi:MAG: hypothetical protein EAZ89_20985 [Bacteroidetes bacterium]|nr:MAG: hypothetical protein EAZ89_20985 [Bacteroidota bacterium]